MNALFPSDPAPPAINPGDGVRAVLLRAVTAGPFAVTLKRYRHDFEQDAHEHSHATIDLVVSGWGRGVYRRQEALSTPAAVEYFAPETPHSFRCGPRGVCTMHVVVPGALAAHNDRAGRFLDLALDPSRCLGIAAGLYREITTPGEPDPLVVESLASELLAEACRWPAEAPVGAGWLTGVIEQLMANPCQSPSLSALARHASLHPSHLAREFRRSVGISVGEYGRRLRLSATARRLAANDEPLARVAHECGYADQPHLSRQLKSRTGLTPRALRRLFTDAPGAASP